MSARQDFQNGLAQNFGSLSKVILETVIHLSAQKWLDTELKRCTDLEWTKVFEEHAVHFSLPQSTFLNRIFDVNGVQVLGAIRFYGGDFSRPFVDIFAWTSKPDWAALRKCVAKEWDIFKPRSLRVLVDDNEVIEAATFDQTIHVRLPVDMIDFAAFPLLTLESCDNSAEAFKATTLWYAELKEDMPHIKAEVFQSEIEDLEDCQRYGALNWINIADQRAGLIAVAPSNIAWLSGMVMNEIILGRRFRGKGYGRFIQREIASYLLSKGLGEIPLIGTIQRLNEPSRRTAISAGRPSVLKYLFLDLTTL